MYIVIPTPDHKSTDTKNDAFHYNFKYKGNDDGVYAVYSWRFNEEIKLKKITRALAHEIAEASTNPQHRKKAFVDSEHSEIEIADPCQDDVGIVNGVTVEGYWSNSDGGCKIPGEE